MTQILAPERLLDREVYDRAGDKIGKTSTVIVEEASRRPAFLSIRSGFLGMNDHVVPLEGARMDGDHITVAYDKNRVKDAPSFGDHDELSAAEERRLYEFYGLLGVDSAGSRPARDGRRAATATGTGSRKNDDAMTRSEERLHVGTERAETRRVKLRKYIVTENVQTTVPVSHEEVRVEREPITDANREAALSGPPLTEDEHEVTLHAERPIASKETVPVERVRLSKDTVTDQAQINEKVKKERIEEKRS